MEARWMPGSNMFGRQRQTAVSCEREKASVIPFPLALESPDENHPRVANKHMVAPYCH